MKTYNYILAFMASLSFSTHAATVISGYTNPSDPGSPFLYESKIIFEQADSWSGEANDVGGWSYRNTNPTANQNRGWGHASYWYLIELQEDSYLNITVTSADPTAWAGFVLYSGESVIDDAGQAHNYSNNGVDMATLNGGWDLNTPKLSYVTHGHNLTTQSATETRTIFAPAGLYTLAVGNAANSATSPAAVDYSIHLLTVPEPSSLILGALSLTFIGRRRRR